MPRFALMRAHPFSKRNLPPNGWNCRCTTVQVRKGKYPQSDPTLAMQRGDNSTASLAQQIFRYNPGKTLQLFPPRHPYYKAPEEAKKVAEHIARIEQNRREYERLKEDPDYKDVHFNPQTGGVKATHKGHNTEDTTVVAFGMTGPQLEKECQNCIFDMGHSAILRNEKELAPNGEPGYILPALDLELDGKLMDIRSLTTNHNYGNALTAKNKQLGNLQRKTGVVSDCVCLYFHDSSLFSNEQMLNGIEHYKSKIAEWESTQRIKHIYCIVNGEKEMRIYDIQ